MSYWLLKSEPSSYSIDDLARDKKTRWDGVRNYQARNFMHDEMRVGDRIFFYHSGSTFSKTKSAEDPAITGEGRVCSKPYPDPTQFDKKSRYYDPRATKEKPRWFLVDVCFVRKFKREVTRKELQNVPGLENMILLKQGSRLSVQPVSKKEHEIIMKIVSK
jgi:predicted RNA-binding protein with PUA-like domain